MTEYHIGATELRQKLTDVIETIREQNAVYLVETFGRPQVVMISLDEYQRWRSERLQVEDGTRDLARAAFGMWSGRTDLDDAWLTNSRDQWVNDWKDKDVND